MSEYSNLSLLEPIKTASPTSKVIPAPIFTVPSTTNSIDVPISKLKIKSVTVFNDRAEIVRGMRLVTAPGFNTVLLTHVSKSIDSNSIRIEGQGAAEINDYKFIEKNALKVLASEVNLHADQITVQLSVIILYTFEKYQNLEQERKRQEKTLERLVIQKRMVDGIASQFGTNILSSISYNVAGTMDNKFLTQFIDSYLDYYAIRAKKIDEELAEVEREMDTYKDDIKKLTKDVNWDQNNEITNMPAKIEVRLKAAEKLDIDIEVKYVVMDASWEPRYEMWIEKGADFIRLVYYGFVKQNTDEDWDDIGNLVLSNAQTQTNMGDIPLQYVINVAAEKTKENVELIAEFPEPKPRNEALPKIRKDVQVSRFDTSERKHFSYVFSPHDLIKPTSSKAHKSSENKGSSGPFVIPTKPKIKSDNTTHSVTIASLDLPAAFEYESVPSQASHAYTKVTITNSSMFLLLAGRVSLYLDEYFLTSNRIENVGASEQFCFTLCVDSSVRVLYKTGGSNQIVSGFFNKVITDVRTKEVYIKNNSSKPIRITVIEPLPKSVDSNVKVTLLAPMTGKGERESVIVNKNSNIEWSFGLRVDQKRALTFKYQLEYPATWSVKLFDQPVITM